jgi:hypothetical protein
VLGRIGRPHVPDMDRRFAFLLLCSLAIGCGPSHGMDAGMDGSTTDAEPDADGPDAGRCISPDGEDLGPLEPPADACAIADAEPENELAAAACLAIQPFIVTEWDFAYDYLLGDVSARRFGLEVLAHLWPAYEQLALDDPWGVGLLVFARVGDPEASVTADELAMLDPPIDSLSGPALHCMDHPLPEGYAELLEESLGFGGYVTTHVLLALLWMRDVGCEIPTNEDFYEAALAANAALIDDDHASTTDLEIEAATFLTYLGEGHRVPEGFVEGVIANQLPEGGFTDEPDSGPNGHTSGLGLWYLHEVLFPDRRMPMVNPCLRTWDP